MKIAVITGASRGLGLVLARVFNDKGWQVVGTGRSPRPAKLPEAVAYHQFDAGDAAAGEAFWQQLSREYKTADICLLNNAGDYVSGSLLETSPEQYQQQMANVYFTAVHMTRSLVSVFEQARIINVISTSALAPHKHNSAYGAAKAAEMHFFQSLQDELAVDRYDITNLYPKDIASDGPRPNAIDPTDLAQYIAQLAELDGTFAVRDITLFAKSEK